jgi:hypothetical protein
MQRAKYDFQLSSAEVGRWYSLSLLNSYIEFSFVMHGLDLKIFESKAKVV